MKEPGKQDTHADQPARLYDPELHDMHGVDVLAAKVPAAQMVQLEFPVKLYEPDPHAVHEVLRFELLNVPGEQRWQAAVELEVNWPGWQLTHALNPENEKLPLGQSKQGPDQPEGENCPALQLTQGVNEV